MLVGTTAGEWCKLQLSQLRQLDKDRAEGFLGGDFRQKKKKMEPQSPAATRTPKLTFIALGVRLRSTLSVNQELLQQKCFLPL